MASFYGGVGVGSGGSGSGGLSIANIEIDANRHFIIYLSDGTKKILASLMVLLLLHR